VELPIFLKNMNHPSAGALNSVVAMPPRSHPGVSVRAVTFVRIAPFDNAQECVIEQNDSGIEGVGETLSILIVDDSSANRSGSLAIKTQITIFRTVLSTVHDFSRDIHLL